MNGPDSDTLLNCLAAGDERAFETLYDQYAARMFRTALRLLGSKEDAEDVVQEVFLSTVRSRERLKNVRDLTAYLFAALHRAAGKCALRRGKAVPASTAVEEAVAAEDASLLDNPDWLQLQKAIRLLPDDQREVVFLKIEGELTFAQIAQVTGVSLSTAASRYHYALQKLKNAMVGSSVSLEDG